MSPDTERLLVTAQTLPLDERIELVEALVAGFDEVPTLDETCWAEIRRRSAEYDAGGITPSPWSDSKRVARGVPNQSVEKQV